MDTKPAMKHKTIAQFAEDQRLARELEYLAKYPDGRFCLQRRTVRSSGRAVGYAMRGLHWEPRPCTSHMHFHGVSVEFRQGPALTAGIPRIKTVPYRNNCYGINEYFGSLSELTVCAHKRGVPQDVIDTFLSAYAKRLGETP